MYGKGLLSGLEFMPPEMRRHIYDLARLKITIDPDFSFELQGDINANVIRYSKEAEDYAQKQRNGNGAGQIGRQTFGPRRKKRTRNYRPSGAKIKRG